MPVSFAIISALIQPNSRCRVTVSDAGVDRVIDCIVLQIDPSGVVVESDQGYLFFSLDVVKLIAPIATNGKIKHFACESGSISRSSEGSPAASTSTNGAIQPEKQPPADLTPAPPTTAVGAANASTNGSNGREMELLQQFARAPLIDLALPALSLPARFEAPPEQRELERTKSRLEYALKISEPERIDDEITRLTAWTQKTNPSSSFRAFLGDLATSRRKFEDAARQYELVPDLSVSSLLQSSVVFARVGKYSKAVSNLTKYLRWREDVDDEVGLFLLQCCSRFGSLHPDLEPLYESATNENVRKAVKNAIMTSLEKNASPTDVSFNQSITIQRSPQHSRHLDVMTEDRSSPISGIGIIQNYSSTAKRGLIYDGKLRLLLQFDGTASFDDLTLGALSVGLLGVRVRYAGVRQPNLEADGIATSATFIDAPRPAGHAESKAKEGAGGSSRDIYNRAKQAERERKYDLAARLFLEEVKGRGRQAESAMKDLAMLYARRGEVEQAIQLLYGNEHLITNFRAYHNILAHTLLKAKRYDDAISEYTKVSALIPASNVAERNTVERNIALAYAQTKRFDLARTVLQKILKQSPNDETTRNILERLEDLVQALERDKTLRGSPDLLDRLKIGVSDFQYYFIRRCDFSVLDERARSRGYFVAQDFSDVDTEIRKIGNERKPKRRGEFFLTLAAMAAKADAIDDETQMHSYLANFFSNWAEYAINERFHRDAVRSLLTEAMLISSESNLIDRCAKLYMISFSNEQLEANEFFGRTRHHPSRILQETLVGADSRRHCHKLLKYIVARNPSASNLAETAHRIEDSLAQGDRTDGDYSSSADDRRQIIRQQVRDSLPISQIALQQYLLTLQNCEPLLEFELDRKKTKRLAAVVQTIIRLLDEQDYTDKENYTRQIVGELGTIEAEINGDASEKYEAGPTHWLVEGLLPNIDLLRSGVRTHFEQFRKAASARVLIEDIRADGHYPVDKSGSVGLDLAISLSGNSPIEALKLLARPSSSQTPHVVHIKGALRSQERREVSIPINLSASERLSPVVSVEVIAQYEERASERKNEQKFTMPIRLGGSTFEPIKNRFSNGAGGAPVEEPEMFFGRDDLIREMDETICDGAEGSSFVIYGQQRSGKSSILRQLKNRLSKRCFVVEISLGELGSQMELWQLSYLVRNKIEEELEDLQITTVGLPDLHEIKSEPLTAFSQTIRKTRQCLQTFTPSRQRIVVLIDEFSYINSSHIHENVRLDFMRFWKAMLQANLFSAVLAAQNDWPLLRRRYSNQLAVSKEVQISFLDQEQAIQLASKPILYQGRSRFLGASLDRVFAMSGGSPFYIQRICDELVKFLNARRDNFISDAHVDRIFEKVLREWELSDFHSQYAMRDIDTLEQSETKNYVKFLTMVAERTSDGPKTANAFGQDVAMKEQLDEGLRRLELERDSTGKVAIKVGLFAAYLRRHADLTS